MKPIRPLTLALIGCGARGQTYTRLLSTEPERYRLVAAADARPERVARVRALAGDPTLRVFPDAASLLAAGRLADVAIVATHDNAHHEQCMGALRAGYHVLLEKPIATRPDQVLEIAQLARACGRRVMVCFVLRFAAFYRKAKEIIDSGALGDIESFHAGEGVMPWHQAHSFVRGHWAIQGRSSPMLLSKCCHDTDIIHWLIGRRCTRVAGFGSLGVFHPGHAPEGAPARCTDGCPAAAACPYNALRYAGDRRVPWLAMVHDRADEASPEEIVEWLRTSPWGRCVYRCDNDVVDRQVVAMEFDGGATGSFTMTAFDNGRHLEIHGTRATLKGGDTYRNHFGAHLILFPHEGPPERYSVQARDGGYELHGGGDPGLIDALEAEMTRPDGDALEAPIESTVHSHMIAFAAEEARLTGRTVALDEFERRVAGQI